MKPIEIIDQEIKEKQRFAEECTENDDMNNASYWNNFVHGLKFARDVLLDADRGLIVCPECGHEQDPILHCEKCGHNRPLN